MTQTVIGIFKYKDDVESAIKELKELKYDPKDMSLVMKDVKKAETVQKNTGATVAEGAGSGAATGGVIGGLTGLLVGIGILTLPGVGALLIAGPIAAALGLTGAAATTTTGAVAGAMAGGLVGGLMSLGFSKEEAQKYEEEIKGGGMLLAVPTLDKRAEEVRTILTKHKASEVRQVNLPTSVQDHR